jgi:ubiquinol-cytochrome c reductase cytochrome c subunit
VTGVRGRAQILAIVAALVVTGVASPFAAAASRAGDDDGDDGELLPEQGRDLYATGCSSCHGADGTGVEPQDGGAGGPSLVDAGEAGAYFQLSTGRMPAASSDEQPQRKEPAYSPDEIDALVAYVASLGDGPELPDVDLSNADLAAGGMIYRADCQACHSAAGSGGALSYGSAAPRLGPATPEQIAAAVRVGPGQMPVFDPDIITDDDLDDLVSYVRYLDDPVDPGGLPIGRTGPIPEGFVAWLVGMVALIGLVVWIGTRAPLRRTETTETAETTGATGTTERIGDP